jgi:hypothetical protein
MLGCSDKDMKNKSELHGKPRKFLMRRSSHQWSRHNSAPVAKHAARDAAAGHQHASEGPQSKCPKVKKQSRDFLGGLLLRRLGRTYCGILFPDAFGFPVSRIIHPLIIPTFPATGDPNGARTGRVCPVSANPDILAALRMPSIVPGNPDDVATRPHQNLFPGGRRWAHLNIQTHMELGGCRSCHGQKYGKNSSAQKSLHRTLIP